MTFGSSASSSGPTPSAEYPAKVFFHTPTPEVFLANGYTGVRLEKRALGGVWEAIPESEISPALFMAGQYNYVLIDPYASSTDLYRGVVFDGTGVEPDVPQPPSPAIDSSYEAVMTIQELKDIYLWGQDPAFISDVGQYQPDYTFAHNIRYGIAKVERKLSIRLLPRLFSEAHDWMREGGSFGGGHLHLYLDEFPVRSVQKLEVRMPGASTPYEVPLSWLRIDRQQGRVSVVPDGAGGQGVPAGFGLLRERHVPGAFVIDYVAGVDFEVDNTLPPELKEVVGKEASFGPLNVGGDLVGGAGLAGTSLSMDGLSQSVTTTNSSTNAGFGARLIQYEKELRETYKTLIPFYKGIRMRTG